MSLLPPTLRFPLTLSHKNQFIAQAGHIGLPLKRLPVKLHHRSTGVWVVDNTCRFDTRISVPKVAGKMVDSESRCTKPIYSKRTLTQTHLTLYLK